MKKTYLNFLLILSALISGLGFSFGELNTGTSAGYYTNYVGECGAANGMLTATTPTANLCLKGTAQYTDTAGVDGDYNRYCYIPNLSGGKVACSAGRKYMGYKCYYSGNNLGWIATDAYSVTRTSLGTYYAGSIIYTSYPIPDGYVCAKNSLTNGGTGSLVQKIVDGIQYAIPSLYNELKRGSNLRFFEVLGSIYYGLPFKAIRPVITSTGTRDLYFLNKSPGMNFYIPYDSGVNCDTYRQNKTAINERGYFSVFCKGCGVYQGQDVSGKVLTLSGDDFLYAYKYTGSVNCNLDKEMFYCDGQDWKGINTGVLSSNYPNLSCKNYCSDWRNGSTAKFTHGTYVTGYTTSASSSCESITNARSFVCNDGIRVGSGLTTGYTYLTCVYSVAVTGSCGIASGVNTLTFPVSNLCSGSSSVSINDLTGTDGVFNWTCNGTGGGANMSCSAVKSVLVITGSCGSASGLNTISFPASNLCNTSASITNDDTNGTDGVFNWTCNGTGGGANVSCSANKVSVITGSCGSASGLNFSLEPNSTQLCSSYSTISQSVVWTSTSYNSTFSWTCNGANGGSSMSCSLNKVYPYYQYQCQLNDATSLKWQSVNYPAGAVTPSSTGTVYNSGNTVYASPTVSNTYYVGGYMCKADGACGSSNGMNFSSQPLSNLCSVGTNGAVSSSGNYRIWSCAGINGGNAVMCSANKIINATCGSANGNSYITEPNNTQLCGTFSVTKSYGTWSSLAENATANWICNGVNGGTDANCNATKVYYPRYQCQFSAGVGLVWQPVAGTNSTSSSTSTQYYLSDYVYSSSTSIGSYSCTCPASTPNFDINNGCVAAAVVTTGSCGAANRGSYSSFPSSNKCSTYASITNDDTNGTDGTYNWTCNGANGGASASCSATKIVVTPVCGGSNGGSYVSAPSTSLCSVGSPSAVSTYTNSFTWYCIGTNAADASCSATRVYPTNGVCSSTHYNCSAGSSQSNAFASNKYTRSCAGTNGGSTDSCSECANGYVLSAGSCVAIVNGACNTTTTSNWYSSAPSSNLCSAGTAGAVTSNTNNYSWYCNGANGGSDAYCSATRVYPSTGQCNSLSPTYSYPTNGCYSGSQTAVDTTASDWTFNWTCAGTYGGGTVPCSNSRKQDGACGNADNKYYEAYNLTNSAASSYFTSLGLCDYTTVSATASSSAGSTTWSCVGKNGGWTDNCSATYASLVYTCPAANVASAVAGTYSVPQLNGGGSSSLSASAGGVSCSTTFTCPANGGSSVKGTETCSKTSSCGGSMATNAVSNGASTYLASWTVPSAAPTKSWSYNTTYGDCNYKCPSGYSRDGSICGLNCGSKADGLYSVPALNHGSSQLVSSASNVSIVGGTKTCSVTYICSQGTSSKSRDEGCSLTCDSTHELNTNGTSYTWDDYCSTKAICGNGIVEGTEVCDGADDAQSCSFGGVNGFKYCSPKCNGYGSCYVNACNNTYCDTDTEYPYAAFAAKCYGSYVRSNVSTRTCETDGAGDLQWTCTYGSDVQDCDSYLYYCPDTYTCFVAGTRVILADGTKKDIEDVQLGDKLLGENNSINEVKGYDRPKLGSRLLYSINGKGYFVTAEHPFKTLEGWKSINPKATKKEMPDFDVEALAIGDLIYTEDGMEYVFSIESRVGNANQQLYNFVLDGNNTYYANGYLVHNKLAQPAVCYTCTRTSDCPANTACRLVGSELACEPTSTWCNYRPTDCVDGQPPVCPAR